MRYLAILKDSFREALDSKVMLVLVGLSTAAILMVATLGCRPLSAEQTMNLFFPTTEFRIGLQEKIKISSMFVLLHQHELNKAEISAQDFDARAAGKNDIQDRMRLPYEYELQKVELVRGEPDSPQSDYLLTVVDSFRRMPSKDDPAALAEGAARVRGLFKRAEELGFFHIAGVETSVHPGVGVGGKVHYHITLQSTPQTFRIWATEPTLGFGVVRLNLFFGTSPTGEVSVPLAYVLYVLSRAVLFFGAWVAILVGVIITSFFIPNMLGKGTIDMLLVKPIRRSALLSYKYVGGLTFILLNSAYAFTGMWLVLGLRTGLWANGLFLLILTMTFFFAILYAISTFVGLLTRSTIAAILLTIGAWAVFFGIGYGHNKFESLRASEERFEKIGQPVPADQRWGDSKFATTFRLLNNTLTPRTEDLNEINDLIIYSDFLTGDVTTMSTFAHRSRSWWTTILVAAVWIIVFLTLSCLWFCYRDY
jgi:ABC-type transport system involved in multi-copper enzyme maturation permease subunit